MDSDHSEINSYLNKQKKEYFYDFNLNDLKALLRSVVENGIDETSIYFKKVDKIVNFIENASNEFQNYDAKIEIEAIKQEINKDKLRFFKKAVMFDGKQRDIVMDKIDEKDKELTYEYEYIADNILTSLWKAGFEEKIERVFLDSKVEELPYFHFSNYNKMLIDNKVSHIYY